MVGIWLELFIIRQRANKNLKTANNVVMFGLEEDPEGYY